MQDRLNKLYDAAEAVSKTKGRIPARLLRQLRDSLKDCKLLRDVTEGDPERYTKILEIAESITRCPGVLDEDDLEIDPAANLSEGDDNGTFIECWLWVPFAGTELDKEKEEEAVNG